MLHTFTAFNYISLYRLPPPNIVLKETAPSIDAHVDDDPNCHNGRVRTFAHERGNWATFVYVQCEKIIIMKKCINIYNIRTLFRT